ncbi:MAG: carbohydrate porin [Prevotellaceae bacterium]|nr:carbohydrate porin [Prevotellaceae bacterium]
MRKKTLLAALALASLSIPAFSQTVGGEMTSEWQWSPNKKTVNWMNMLRLDFEYSPWKGGTFQAATLHMAKTNPEESIISDYQVFSNIQEENCYAAIAVLGYEQSWKHAKVFFGVRNMNEDYFASPVTSFFTNSSPGIFPSIAANYPIANYPVSSMTIHLELQFDEWHIKNSLYNGAAYNGWKRGDNPFMIRPKRDGVFDVLELSYDNGKSFYSVGSTFHNRVFDEDMQPMRKYKRDTQGNLACDGYESKASFGWWAYAEQCLWQNEEEDKKVSLMVQYSENTRGKKYIEEIGGCKRYAELGCLYDFGDNHAGFTAQYAHYGMGKEESIELTYSRDVKDCLSLQPVFNYIHNAEEKGNYVVFSGRLIYSF